MDIFSLSLSLSPTPTRTHTDCALTHSHTLSCTHRTHTPHTLSRLHLDKLRLIFYILYSFFIFPKTRDRDFRTSSHQRNDSTTHIRSSNAGHRFRKVLCLVGSCSLPTALASLGLNYNSDKALELEPSVPFGLLLPYGGTQKV